jgi:RNA polymerase sigma-70 factor, ECF subfamily
MAHAFGDRKNRWTWRGTALVKVRAHQREALLLVAAEGMSYEEAAQVTGIPEGTVKSRVNRARNRLADLLDLRSESEIGPNAVAKAAIAAG